MGGKKRSMLEGTHYHSLTLAFFFFFLWSNDLTFLNRCADPKESVHNYLFRLIFTSPCADTPDAIKYLGTDAAIPNTVSHILQSFKL